ncbi:MAG TPA: ATP-binding protein, partial [Bacteroidales bacterium]|nr:ATP-binding protein [Bacteroidales bacterium]
MSGSQGKKTKDLENIIRALADVWPAERDNVAVAGAQFEDFISTFEDDPGQLQKLIDIAWKGLRHLYEKDEFFISVKTATMQAVNAIREYLLENGDIQVDVFEKAYDDLYDALLGKKESADELIEIDKPVNEAAAENQPKTSIAEQSPKTLDDLASYIIGLDEDNISSEYLEALQRLLQTLSEQATEDVSNILSEALEIVYNIQLDNSKASKDWLSKVAGLTEKAIEVETDQQWTESDDINKTSQKSGKDDEDQPEAEAFYIPENIDTTMVGEFVTECTELLEMAERALLDLEGSPGDDELINKVFRAFHTIKGTSAFMGLDPISEFTHLLETVLSMIRDGNIAFDKASADISLEAIDIINNMLAVVEASGPGDHLPKPINFKSLTKVLYRISTEKIAPEKALDEAGGIQHASLKSSDEASPIRGNNVAKDGTAKNKSDDSQSESTIRVNVSRLDQLIDMIGELVIAHSVVAQDESIPDHSNLQKKINHTSKILRALQDTSLTLRMVPLNTTFHKMNRLVRDLTRKVGKPVKLNTFGEETEIDRNMVDIINEPLVHMIRNAIDHGIETPGEREKSGKPEEANIWLRASQEGGKVVIEIEDDGQGINKKKILEKAVSKGLVDPGQNLTDKEIHNLIFLPGFSSNDEVTELSGRGVGMDVVRKSIEQLKGKVDVESEEGKGTKIIIELPFTLAITDGMLVKVGAQRFIIPTLNIDQAFRAREEDIFTVMGKSEKVTIRGETVPVVRLDNYFNIENGKENLTKGTLLA